MDIRLVFCIAMGVFVTYIGVAMLITQFQRKPYIPPPKPNFTSRATTYVDPKTGEKTTYREITVSTKFAQAEATPPPSQPRLETVERERERMNIQHQGVNIQDPTSNVAPTAPWASRKASAQHPITPASPGESRPASGLDIQ